MASLAKEDTYSLQPEVLEKMGSHFFRGLTLKKAKRQEILEDFPIPAQLKSAMSPPEFKKNSEIFTPFEEKILVKVNWQLVDIGKCLSAAISFLCDDDREKAEEALLLSWGFLVHAASTNTKWREEALESKLGISKNPLQFGGESNLLNDAMVSKVRDFIKLKKSLPAIGSSQGGRGNFQSFRGRFHGGRRGGGARRKTDKRYFRDAQRAYDYNHQGFNNPPARGYRGQDRGGRGRGGSRGATRGASTQNG